MLVIICATYGKNSSRIVCVVERKWQDVPYFSSFIAKSWLNDLKDIGQSQMSLHVTDLPMLVIICAYYGKNPTRSVELQSRTDGWMDGVEQIYPPTISLCGGIKRILIWNYNIPILTSLLNRNSDTKAQSFQNKTRGLSAYTALLLIQIIQYWNKCMHVEATKAGWTLNRNNNNNNNKNRSSNVYI